MRIIQGHKHAILDADLAEKIREYAKIPHAVKAVQQDRAFDVRVSWQDVPLSAQAGDWLVTDGSESWPVEAALFIATYEQTDDGQYVKVASVKAVRMKEDFQVNTLEGAANGAEGDWLCQGAHGELWPICNQRFIATYLVTL